MSKLYYNLKVLNKEDIYFFSILVFSNNNWQIFKNSEFLYSRIYIFYKESTEIFFSIRNFSLFYYDICRQYLFYIRF